MKRDSLQRAIVLDDIIKKLKTSLNHWRNTERVQPIRALVDDCGKREWIDLDIDFIETKEIKSRAICHLETRLAEMQKEFDDL